MVHGTQRSAYLSRSQPIFLLIFQLSHLTNDFVVALKLRIPFVQMMGSDVLDRQ